MKDIFEPFNFRGIIVLGPDMIKNTDKLKDFERKEIMRKDISHKDALAIFEGLRKEAVSLGAYTHENILEGLEIDIKIAKAVNGLQK